MEGIIDITLYIALLAVTVEIIFFAFIDKRKFDSWFTPFSALAFPYLTVLYLAVLFSVPLGFIAISAESIFLWIAGIVAFWLGGRLVRARHGATVRLVTLKDHEKILTYYALIPAWIAIGIMIFNLMINVSIVDGLQEATAGDIFTNIHYGTLSLSKIAGMAFIVILVGTTTRKKYFTNFTIVSLIAASVLYQVKGDLLIPLLGGCIYRSINFKLQMRWYHGVLIIAMGYVIFNIFYLFLFYSINRSWMWFDLESYKYMFHQFMTYLYSGTLSLSYSLAENDVRKSYDIAPVLFTSLINMFRHINGTYSLYQPIHVLDYANLYNKIDLQNFGGDSNVHTFIGTIIMYMGWLYGLLYIYILGVISYVLYIYSKINIWIGMIYSLIAGALFFGWFEYYYWHAFFILIISCIIILAGVYTLFNNKHRIR